MLRLPFSKHAATVGYPASAIPAQNVTPFASWHYFFYLRLWQQHRPSGRDAR
ncbi:hypothetical protein KCP73_01550 [Salmonella enterica subsp. enterica]|nr:hypothetical protein KCP73_01550 [Salmonella enterica subsp. enterica]